MKNLLMNLVTGKDNRTHDLVRWLGLVGALQALALQAYAVVWQGQPFDLQAYGIGLGALIVTVGAALGLKKDTEPGQP
jgi:hypothetical protein